jgi:hypothetical protein
VTTVAGDPASCSQLGGALRRSATVLRTSGAAVRGEVGALTGGGERPAPVLQRSRRRVTELAEVAAATAVDLDAAGTALQGHAADLGEAVAAVRDVVERARAAGLEVSDTQVTTTWGVAGVADAAATAAREQQRAALQRELDQVLTVLAHRRDRLSATLRAVTDALAARADELRR